MSGTVFSTTLKGVLALVLLSAACILLIRLQPYDDTDLLHLLMPPNNCMMPCFLGIHPGETTVDEAVAILQAHEWVSEVRINNAGVLWKWNAHQPDFLQLSEPGFHAFLETDGRIVTSIQVGTSLQLGNIWLAFGEPQQGSFGTMIRGDTAKPDNYFVFQTTAYDNLELWILVDTRCPINPSKIWHSRVSLEWNSTALSPAFQRYNFAEVLNTSLHC
jgi:hypothetical protein